MIYSCSIGSFMKGFEGMGEVRAEAGYFSKVNTAFGYQNVKSCVLVIKDKRDFDAIAWEYMKPIYDDQKFVVGISSIDMIPECRKRGLEFFWLYPVTTYFELQGLLKLGVSQVKIGLPLAFDLPNIKKNILPENVKIRISPNVAYDAYIPHENGIQGFYIRPEDMKLYEGIIDVIEMDIPKFAFDKERELIKVYQSGEWNGNLNLLLTNLNFNVDNRIFDKDFGERRLNCKQKCMSDPNSCHYCPIAFQFADAINAQHNESKKK